MAKKYEDCTQHYSDWNDSVTCSFKNVFNTDIARVVGNNVQSIASVGHFKTEEMAKQVPSTYVFRCSRTEANSIRNKLALITTGYYSHIWFTINKDPFHYIYNRRSMLTNKSSKIQDYSVFCNFGSMYSYSTFKKHGQEHPSNHYLRIFKRNDQPELISIMSKDKSNQICIPVRWIQESILVNIHDQPSVILMLKHSVKIKRENNQSLYERVCKTRDDAFEAIISKSSDILLEFSDSYQTYQFVDELTHATDEYHKKFTINFVTLKTEFVNETNDSFSLPMSASYKQRYGMNTLYSLGYVFQDKYSKEIHKKFVEFDNELFNKMCFYLKDKLEENHCYPIEQIFNDFTEKNKEEEQYDANRHQYCIGHVSITPLRIVYHKMDLSIGNRALRMPQFGGEENFLLVHIREEDGQLLDDFDLSIKYRLKLNMLNGISGIRFTDAEKISSDEQFTVTRIDDIETEDKKYCFTDGIGKMSLGVACLVAEKLNIKVESRDYIPSAYQVRIAGCKGMLAIDPESGLQDYYIKIQPSMEKFKSNNWDLEIVEYSRPLELKFNNQVIMLLSDLGNAGAAFESYQNTAMQNLSTDNQKEQNRKLRYSSTKEDLLRNKIPLPNNEARNMFGVADETGTLEYGQVFIQYKHCDSKNADTYEVVTGDVLVTKMPCLYPGDFRKLTAVDIPQLRSCIRDCIVFPTKGPRPHPHEMSGSDLDGDQYWVYWGKQLKIEEMHEPLSYEPSQKQTVPNITNEIIIDHIIDSFSARSVGFICDVHLAIADYHPDHTQSAECKKLAELFARAVDAPKTGEIISLKEVYKLKAEYCNKYPAFMKKYDQPICKSTTILSTLFFKAREHFFRLHRSNWIARPSHSPRIPSGGSNTPRRLIFPLYGTSVVRANGNGYATNHLNKPEGLLTDDDGENMFITDTKNDRVLKWKTKHWSGEIVAGGNGAGNELNQLNNPTNMLIDKETNSFIICDWQNHRLVRWSCLKGTTEGEILINNIHCSRLTMDHQGYLYISDTEKHEVRRYKLGEDMQGTLVASGNGKGDSLNQFDWPTHIFVDQTQAIYVSDSSNNRIMRWDKDATEGVIVAGGNGKGDNLNQFSYPLGLFVDTSDTVYVADSKNNRVVRWPKGAANGTVIAGAFAHGTAGNQLSYPKDLFFDRRRNVLYVLDSGNRRVQKFSMDGLITTTDITNGQNSDQ